MDGPIHVSNSCMRQYRLPKVVTNCMVKIAWVFPPPTKLYGKEGEREEKRNGINTWQNIEQLGRAYHMIPGTERKTRLGRA